MGKSTNPVAADPRVVAAELKRMLSRAGDQRRWRRKCARKREASREEKDRENAKQRDRNKRRRERDPEKYATLVKEKGRRHRRRHPDQGPRLMAAWAERNPERVLASSRVRCKRYKDRLRTDKVHSAAMALHGELMPVLPLPST